MSQTRMGVDGAVDWADGVGGKDHDIETRAIFADRDFRDARAISERRLDFQRRDAIAAGIHDVVGAAMVPEIAVLIERSEVAADEPVATESGRLFLRATPIAEHQSRIAAIDGEKADFVGRQRLRLAGEGNDGDGPAALRFAGTAPLHGHAPVIGDERHALAPPQTLVNLLSRRASP